MAEIELREKGIIQRRKRKIPETKDLWSGEEEEEKAMKWK